MTSFPTVKVAACHVAPIFLNATASTEKYLQCIDDASAKGARLVVFPESAIPGFPFFASTGAPVDNEGCWARFVEQSIYADGPEIAALRRKAEERGVVISIGFSERSYTSVACIWNSNIVIGENGQVLAHHRVGFERRVLKLKLPNRTDISWPAQKLQPTFWEKLVWAPGDGYGLVVNETGGSGRIGALICGENTNPLARFSLMAQNEQIHVMCFPPAWPTKRSTSGYKNKTANAVRAAGHAFEGKCFVIVCAGVLDEVTIKITAAGDDTVKHILDNSSQAQTMFFGPDAVQVGDELCEHEGIAFADFDLNRCVDPKQLHDVVGGYQRYDVFDLRVTRKRDEPVDWHD